jgi:lipid-binding SYLF domain-containing protein
MTSSPDNPFASPGGNTLSSESSSIMMDSPYPIPIDQYQFTSPRPTLRQEADMRRRGSQQSQQQQQQQQSTFIAGNIKDGKGSPKLDIEAPAAIHLTPWQKKHPLTVHSAIKSRGGNSTINNETIASPELLVHSARKEWKQHGSALTQDLEEIRRRDEERPGTVTVRLVSAENRKDVTSKKYTAYILRVKLPNNQVLQLEHRYSEFVKLNDSFRNQCVHLNAVFPPKHLAGRLGNWTPSMTWAPDQFDELVQYRTIQLDVWLVAVAAKYNLGDLPHSLARTVYDFLTLSDRSPCDLENTMAMSGSLSSLSLSTTNYTDNSSSSSSRSSSNIFRFNNPISFTLGSSIRQACRIVEELCMPSVGTATNNNNYKLTLKDTDQSIPLDLLHCAKGLIFLTVVKAGLMVSGRIGTGLLIARVDEPQRWSAPVALGTVGMGWGVLGGGDITHYLVVLTTEEAVESMLRGTVQLGTELGIAIGPVGRTTHVSASASNTEWTIHPAYSYAHSKGLFMGVSLEGSILSMRNDVNSKFYGRSGLTGDQIMDLSPPKAAEPLYAVLDRALATEIPEDGFRPSQLLYDSDDSRGHHQNNNSNNTENISSSGPGGSFFLQNGRVNITSDLPSQDFYRPTST